MRESRAFTHSIYNYYNNVKMYCHVYLIPYEIIREISTSWGTPRMPKVYPRASGRDSGPLASLGPLLDLGAGSTGGPKAYPNVRKTTKVSLSDCGVARSRGPRDGGERTCTWAPGVPNANRELRLRQCGTKPFRDSGVGTPTDPVGPGAAVSATDLGVSERESQK